MEIRKAVLEDTGACLECVKDSLLWDAYFDADTSITLIEDEIRKNRVHVAINGDNRCIGFMGIMVDGCFGKFSYLSILSVHEAYRNCGVGKELLHFFEHEGFEKENRVFVLCSDFNEKGQRFYKKNGYIECGKIPDLFKPGITEHLFVKYTS